MNAYEQGWTDFEKGRALSANRFNRETESYWAWRRGWSAAEHATFSASTIFADLTV